MNECEIASSVINIISYSIAAIAVVCVVGVTAVVTAIIRQEWF